LDSPSSSPPHRVRVFLKEKLDFAPDSRADEGDTTQDRPTTYSQADMGIWVYYLRKWQILRTLHSP